MVEKLDQEDIDKMSSSARRAEPGVDLGAGIYALVDDLSVRELAKPVVRKAVTAAATASVLAALTASYFPEHLGVSASAERPAQTIGSPAPISTPEIKIIKTLLPKPTVTPTVPFISPPRTLPDNVEPLIETPTPMFPETKKTPESIGQGIYNTEEKPISREVREEVFKIKIREGESLSSILSFYNMDRQNVEFYNSDEVAIKMTSEEYNNPYKKLCLPTVGMTITSWEEEWNYGEPGYGDFVAYTTLFPYSFFGHTSKDSSELGTFAGLRETQKGDRFYLSRTWMGEDGDWIEAEVVGIVKVYSTEEEIMVTNRSNSQLLSFTTCFVETGNPDARLMVMVKVVDYYASFP